MVKKKGKITYVPPVIIEEIGFIKRQDPFITKDVEAFKRLGAYAKIGRSITESNKFTPPSIPSKVKQKKYRPKKDIMDILGI